MVLAPTEIQEAQCFSILPGSRAFPIGRYQGLDVLDIAPEIWLAIFHYLDVRDLLRCDQVCREFHTLISSSTHLQYMIELFADGLEDGGNDCSMSSSDRLSLLLARRRAWRDLDYTGKISVRVSGRCHAYELVGGVFAKSSRISHGLDAPRRVIATRLPTRSEEAQSILHKDYDLPARDFAIDPSQDLIALVHLPSGYGPTWDVRVHINSISTNKQHPEAPVHVLSHTVQHSIDIACIQIVDDVVGFWYIGFLPGLVIWNWKTGKTMVTNVEPGTADFCDFTFLNNRSFILTNAQHWSSLDIYNFGEHSSAAQTGIASKVVSLSLPALARTVSCENILIHTGPFVAHPEPNTPFYTAPWSRIITLSLVYRSGDGHARRFCLFVHARTLIQYVEAWERYDASRARLQPEANMHARQLDWEQWGPCTTRLMPQYSSFQWLRYVHGERVVLPPLTIQDGPHAERVLRVLDFRVHPKRRQPSPCDKSVTHLFTENITDQERAVFADPVHSNLPCAIVERQGTEYRYSGFMIDDQRLIGLRASAFSEEDMGDLDVFTF